MNRRIIRLILFTILLFWCAGFSNSLFSGKGYSEVLNLFLAPFYNPVCHQDKSKLISAGFLVCARCSGIYTGALIASLIFLIKSGEVKTFFFLPAAVLLSGDVLFVNAGIYNYSSTVAFSTGLLFGLTLFPYILQAIENSFIHEIK